MVLENKPERLIKETYLACIRNSVGTKMFRNFFLKENGKVFDATENGNLSCAFYVSGLLRMINLIESVHGTVEGIREDLERSGWEKVEEPIPGDVIIWEADESPDPHKHIGFYLGINLAVSNSSIKRQVAKHDWTFDATRKVEAIYSNPILK